MKVSTNRESLENLAVHITAAPFINCILWLRAEKKRLEAIECRLDENGCFRSSYNPGSTDSGRWSSSIHVFNIGGNAQNLEHESRPGVHFAERAIRSMFIARPGRKMANADLEQAESRIVAYESRDEAYIQAHEGGDPHTMVASLCFGLPVTGDRRADREAAEAPYYRHFSYRDMAKRGGHATNYYAKPHTIARHLKIPEDVAKEFQSIYFRTFPGIRRWHTRIINELQTTSQLTTCLGRRRYFFGRLTDDEVARKAIAYKPQSTIADTLNIGLCRVYQMQKDGFPIQILQQGHDAILFEFPEGLDEEIIPPVIVAMEVSLEINNREVIIPVDVNTGYDWHNMKGWESNLDAVRPTPVVLSGHDLLDLRVSSVK